jgi:hypothetical protein
MPRIVTIIFLSLLAWVLTAGLVWLIFSVIF